MRAEIRAGSFALPAFATIAEGVRVGLFALAHDVAPGMALAVTAQDGAGNAASRGVSTGLLPLLQLL